MGGTRLVALQALSLAVGLLVCSSTSAYAAKEVFTRTKPHINGGWHHGEPTQIWLHANAGLFDDGDAVGILQLRLEDGESFLYQVTGGSAALDGDTVLELVLVLERVGEGGDRTGETDLVIIRPSSPDCLIYDFVGPNIQVEVEGILARHRSGDD